MPDDNVDFLPLPTTDPTTPASSRPEPACEHCHGKGYMPGSTAKTFIKCRCVILREARAYLTPVYAGAQYYKTLNPNQLLQRPNWSFDAIDQATFKLVIKSFLLNTGMAYSHATVTAADVMGATYDFENKTTIAHYKDVDLLLLYLVADPKNAHYGKTLIALIEHRKLHGKRTWLYAARPIQSEQFALTYQPEFATYAGANFSVFRVKAGVPTTTPADVSV